MKIHGVQYLRAIAAIAVVMGHAAGMASFEKYFDAEVAFNSFWAAGSLGVNLFFVISGFIIVVSSFTPETLAPKKGLVSFVMARAMRIIPMMWLAIVSYAVLRWLGRGDFFIDPYVNAFFLLPFGDYDPNNIWTLRHEFIFYIVFGVSFLASRNLWPVFALWVSLAVVFGVMFPDLVVQAPSEPLRAIMNVFAPWNLLFASGAIIGVLYLRYPDMVVRLSSTPLVFLQRWWVLAAMFAISMILFKGTDASIRGVLISLPLFVGMVFVACLHSEKSTKLMYYLGEASFSIYLFHPHLESAALGVLAKYTPNIPVLGAAFLVSIFAIVVSCGIYSLVERPLTRYLNGVARGSHRKVFLEPR